MVTFVSIPTLALYKAVKDDAGAFVLGAGSSSGLQWGVLSEVIVGLAGIGTAVVLYPVAKRVSQTAALGFVAARLVETCLIFVSVVSLLSLLTLRNDVAGTAGTDSASLVTIGHTLVANYNWTFLLSGADARRMRPVPGLRALPRRPGAPHSANHCFHRSPAAPGLRYRGLLRSLPQVSPISALAAVPVAVFELSLGIYLIVKGFKSTPLTTEGTSTLRPDPLSTS
ncbi:DUF4386 domain-containing protein [Arthrobacter alpinus]|nr:DUF4386 domain-containing protein [Arthrobacter alpinus]